MIMLMSAQRYIDYMHVYQNDLGEQYHNPNRFEQSNGMV